jgi:hypothetical protein
MREHYKTKVEGIPDLTPDKKYTRKKKLLDNNAKEKV